MSCRFLPGWCRRMYIFSRPRPPAHCYFFRPPCSFWGWKNNFGAPGGCGAWRWRWPPAPSCQKGSGGRAEEVANAEERARTLFRLRSKPRCRFPFRALARQGPRLKFLLEPPPSSSSPLPLPSSSVPAELPCSGISAPGPCMPPGSKAEGSGGTLVASNFE